MEPFKACAEFGCKRPYCDSWPRCCAAGLFGSIHGTHYNKKEGGRLGALWANLSIVILCWLRGLEKYSDPSSKHPMADLSIPPQWHYSNARQDIGKRCRNHLVYGATFKSQQRSSIAIDVASPTVPILNAVQYWKAG